MDYPLSRLTALIPAELDLLSMLKFILVFAAGSLIFSLFARLIFGRRSALNHAVSSAMGILVIYIVTIVVYTFQPAGLPRYLSPLPFVQFTDNYLQILSFHSARFPALCENTLSLIILSFLINALDSLIPKGKNVIRWFLLRFLSVILAIILHNIVNQAFHTFLPGVLVTYAPVILLGILIVMLLLGVLNFLLSFILVAVSPILAGIYAFFFSNVIGKQLSKSILTAGLICCVFYAMEAFGYGTICISAAALISYFPLLLILLGLWYLIGHLL